MTTPLIRLRLATFAATIALLGGLIVWDRHIQYEQSLTAFFPSDSPDVLSYDRATALFGSDNLVFITYDDPDLLTPAGMDRVAELAASVATDKIPAVLEVQSLDRMPLFWELDDRLIDLARLPALARRLAIRALSANVATLANSASTFLVGGAIRQADPDRLAVLRSEIVSHPLLEGTVVNGTGTAASVIVRLVPMEQQEPRETIAALRVAADQFANRHGLKQPALAGPPVLMADGYSAIDADGRRLAGVGMLLIGFVLLSVTRSLWWALVPILAGWTVWRLAETLMSIFDLRLSLSGGPLSAQIVVLTMPAASHLALHFRDELRRSSDRREAARHSLRAVAIPIFWTALAGTVGYGALMTSRVVPVWQFGLILAICTLLASLLTLALSPIAMLPPIPLEIPVQVGSTSRLASWLNACTQWVIDHPRAIVGAVAAIALPLLAGIFFLRYESNYVNAFKPLTRVRQDYESTEARLGGIGVVSLILPTTPEFDLERLRAFRSLDERLAALDKDGRPQFNQVVSPATVLDPQGKISALPDAIAQEALAIKLQLIAASPQAALLSNFLASAAPNNPSGQSGDWARVVVRLSERESAFEKELAFARALASASEVPGLVNDPARTPYIAGLSQLLTQTTRGVIDTSWMTFLWSAGGLLVVLTLAFGRLRLALLALLPTLISVGFVLGLTGWMRIPLDIATALVASVALGLSVDDTFHCLLQYRRHRRAGDSVRDSLLASYQVTGPGVLLSSLAVAVGFSVLRFSEFVPFSNFGTMVGVATLGSSLGNLVLLPACLSLGSRTRTNPQTPTSNQVVPPPDTSVTALKAPDLAPLQD